MLRRGFSLMELLIVMAIVVTLMIIALPYYQGAIQSGNVTATLGAIKTLHAAEQQYFSEHGRFAISLDQLAQPATPLIGPDLGSGEMSGYRFTLSANAGGYAIHASPLAHGVTGKRSFYSDQTMIVREQAGTGPAGPDSPVFKR